MTLPCTVPSKVMFSDTQMAFPLKLHILALPGMVSFFFFYLGWIITLHFLSKSIGNGLMEFMCSFHRYLLHVNSVEVIASPATQQLTCISWMVGNRLNRSLLSIYSSFIFSREKKAQFSNVLCPPIRVCSHKTR